MKIGLSCYLNIMRFTAALLVYFYHAGHFSGIRLPVLSELGGEAVVVFFVLSGFVITYSTMAKPTTAKSFAIDRLARLWSVMIPALALTVFADQIGQALDLSVYGALQPYNFFKWVASISINLLFLSQIWMLNIWPSSNGPFWSINYEFWFYLVFAVVMFTTGTRRLLLMAAILAIAGPIILGSFPIWFLGVALFMYLAKYQRVPPSLAWFLWIATWVLAALAMWMDAGVFLKNHFSSVAEHARWGVNFWPASYALGVLVTLNIYAFSGIFAFDNFLSKHSQGIRMAADTSFGLYLFHYPLLYLTKAMLLSSGAESYFIGPAILLVPLATSIFLAHYCEKLKTTFKRFLRSLFERMAQLMPVFGRVMS